MLIIYPRTSRERNTRDTQPKRPTDENAVEQLVDIAHEPQAIYQILGTIKASLANRDTSDSVLWAAGSDNTQASLETCYATITEISQRIGNLNIQKPDPKAAEPTVILNMAISMTCLYQSQITREVFNTMKEQMAILLERLENEKAERLPKAPPHYDIDRSVIPADLGWSTKRYLADAASMFTEAVQRNDPSIQVSSYFGQQSMATTFWTCHSNMAVGRDYAQIFVTGLPIPNMDKLVVDVDLGDTVAEIRDSILQRLSLVHADFGLMYGNKILTDTTATMKEYNVERNSSLRCVSFRPNRLAPGHWVKTYDLIILTSDRLCVTLQLISGVEYPVPQIKEIFLTEYRRVKKHNFNVNGTIHVTLLSQKKG
ncbi:hypothetical protein FAUST_2096 [Fusarium austroamericanum]|uniref:Ubiquitin-like domain-containing protein n=1 Tax=Fusarium austroamericanum TaxID=282268 RepID=A0AAN6HJ11_FUSAU|nr:hypothetical protein FAUST_2096 [Fusarium austroamericanum]